MTTIKLLATACVILATAIGGPCRADAKQPIIHEPTIYWYRGAFSGDTTTHDGVEFVNASRLGHGAFVYEYPVLSVIPLVQLDWVRDDEGAVNYYNFRAPISFLADRLDAALGGHGFWGFDRFGDPPTWFGVLLRAPNSSIKLRLSRGLRLAFTSRTDILPLHINGDDQGILYTPQLALEWVGLSDGFENDAVPYTNRLHVGVGHANWWSFEGRGRTPGWTVVVGLAFVAGV